MLYKIIKFIHTLDINILIVIQQYLRGPILDVFFVFVTHLGDKGAIWILLALFLLSKEKYREVGVVLLLTLAVNAILGEVIIKNLVERARPFTYFPELALLINQPSSYSFPSGHTAASFAAAGILSNFIPKYTVSVYFLAGLIAFSRIYLFVHFPTDILFGIILGTIVSNYMIKGYNKLYLERKTK